MGYVAAAYVAVAILFAGYAWTLIARQRDLRRRIARARGEDSG